MRDIKVDYGATGANDDPLDSGRIQRALKDGGTILFPEGTYLVSDLWIRCPHTTLIGGGGILKQTGKLNVRADHFKCRDLRHESAVTSNLIAIQVETSEGARDGVDIRDCRFNGFFYAVDCRGTPTRRVSNVLISGCESHAKAAGDAGHFQHLYVTNACCLANRTFGGAEAASYNFVGINNMLRVVGNFDQTSARNDKGSVEIENASGPAVVSGNTFHSRVWIDDSRDVVISGNYIRKCVRITAGFEGTSGVVVSGNQLGGVWISTEPDGRNDGFRYPFTIGNVHVLHNEILDSSSTNVEIGSNDEGIGNIEVDSTHTRRIRVHGNMVLNGVIRYQRHRQLNLELYNNWIPGGSFSSSGAGGYVFEDNNRPRIARWWQFWR